MQIVDGGMFAFAAYHVLQGKVAWPLTFQVPRMLRRLMAESSDAWVVCWNGDSSGSGVLARLRDRPEIWDEAGREDYEAMLEVLAALGVVQYRTEHLEADEAMAALVHRLEGSEPIVIRSDDKDFIQLLSGSTWMEGRVRGTVRSPGSARSSASRRHTWPIISRCRATRRTGSRASSPPRPPSSVGSRGHVRDWIDRDLRVADGSGRGSSRAASSSGSTSSWSISRPRPWRREGRPARRSSTHGGTGLPRARSASARRSAGSQRRNLPPNRRSSGRRRADAAPVED